MATIKADFYEGGVGQNPKSSTADKPSLALALRDVADDLANLRAAVVATHAKLDADGGVTDTDYASSNDPPALLTVKG